MWDGQTVAVVLPTYRERASIREVIRGFERLGVVDEIIVVNNNAEPGTSDEIAQTTAREVLEARQGYGAAIRRGLTETHADLVCVCEPDGTFQPQDLMKLLAYSKDFAFVYGSRTVPDFIWDGANMGRFLRWGNWAVAKLMMVLFNTPSLTDVGCTLRLVRGDAVRSLAPHFQTDGGAFGPEMMLLSIIGGWRIVQIPVNYQARTGAAGTTESFLGAATIGVQMIGMIARHFRLRHRIAGELRDARAIAPEPVGDSPHAGGQPRSLVHWTPVVKTRRRR